MKRASWNGTVIAQSDSCVVVESNQYFPANAVRCEFLRDSSTYTGCPWKGTASYYDVVVNGETNKDAAWYYPVTKSAADNIRGFIAFWKGVKVE